jgi:hypothetical protein
MDTIKKFNKIRLIIETPTTALLLSRGLWYLFAVAARLGQSLDASWQQE